MKLAWSNSDETDPRQARETVRNCGQMLGRLDEVLAFLYVAQHGASASAMRERTTQAAAGLFAVGERAGGDRPGIAPRLGLMLSLRLWKDRVLGHVWLGSARWLARNARA